MVGGDARGAAAPACAGWPPYAGPTLGEAGERMLRTGARWNVNDETTLGLEATHAGNADNALMLQARVRF